MKRYQTLVTALFSCSLMLMLPGFAGYTGYHFQRAILTTEAEINAREVTRLVNSDPELWKLQSARLSGVLERRPSDRTPEIRAVLDLQGRTIEEKREVLETPLLVMQSTVYDAGEPVATLRISRSLRPLLIQVLWLLLAGVLVCGGTYAALQLLSRRALKGAHERLVYEASHDGLTGLPNRALFHELLAQAMARARQGERPLALMFLDIDRFKVVNDSLGHQFGDQLLRHVARTIAAALEPNPVAPRGGDAFTVARLGGDKFAMIIEGAPGTAHTASLARHVLDMLQRPYVHGNQKVYSTASIGIAMYPFDNVDREGLIRHAEMAMYRAKDLGRNTCDFFNEELNGAAQGRMEMESSLRRAVELDEFMLHYQPKADLQTGAVTGVEALLRWQRPGHGLTMPDEFIGALEDNGLIVPVGSWVITTACAQLAAWDNLGMPPLSVAVNLSPRQFRQPDLARQIARALRDTGIAAHRLELELTEGLLMEDSELSREVLAEFSRMGVRIAIDDFGTGHSSLAYLKRFRVNTLKIDRSFVHDVPESADDCAIAMAVVALGHSMKLSVVAEGVETTQQMAFLRTLGCDEMQGYLLSRPLAAEALHAWLLRYAAGEEGFRPRLITSAAPPDSAREPDGWVATANSAPRARAGAPGAAGA